MGVDRLGCGSHPWLLALLSIAAGVGWLAASGIAGAGLGGRGCVVSCGADAHDVLSHPRRHANAGVTPPSALRNPAHHRHVTAFIILINWRPPNEHVWHRIILLELIIEVTFTCHACRSFYRHKQHKAKEKYSKHTTNHTN